MVFKFVKSMFTSTEIKGELILNKETILKDCILSQNESNLEFKNKSETKAFELKEIQDLKLFENTLSFTYEHKKYKYKANKDISEIYTKIHPLITQNKEIYKSDKLVYKIFNVKLNIFKEVLEKVELFIIEDDKTFFLKIETEHEIIHFEEINTDTQYYMDNKTNTFVWSVLKDNLWYTFCIVFRDNISYLEFLSKYVMCTYRSTNKQDNVENEEYFEKMELDNYNEEESDVFNEESDEFKSFSEESEVCELKKQEFGDKNDRNEHLAVGNNIAFVTRGKSIGIFEKTENDLEFKTNLSNIMENSARKILPHDKSNKIIYQDHVDIDKLHNIDLNRPDIVESWNIERDINDFFDGVKLGEDNTLVGLSDYSVFKIDPRSKDKVILSKDYKTKNEFKCGMSTAKGHVAVASKNGDLRLYDKIDKRAKSLLPGFGDEVKFVDVTSNGNNIICTCKNYLLLYTVDGNYKNQVGKEKPIPKRLTLRPEHLAYINEEVNFTPAKFSTDTNEDSIITSTGKYIIKWNLKDVLNGKIFSYHISKCSDLVVADNFELGDNDSIIVTLPDDVRNVKGSVLRRPNKSDF